MAPPLRGDEVLKPGWRLDSTSWAWLRLLEAGRQAKSGHLKAEAAHTPETANEGVLEAEDPVEVGHVRQGLHRSPSVQSGCFVTVNKSKNCPEAHPNSRGPVQLLYDPAVAVEDSGEQRFVSTTTRAHKLRHGGNCRPGGRAAEWWKNC